MKRQYGPRLQLIITALIVFNVDIARSQNTLNDQVISIIENTTNLKGYVNKDEEPAQDTNQIGIRRQELAYEIHNYGPNSMRTGIGYDNLAVALKHGGKFSEAERYSKKALNTFIPLRGMNNKSVAITLDNLASLYDEVGNFVDALPLRLKAVELFENLNGVNPVNVSISRENVAATYLKLGDNEKAIEYLKKASRLYPSIGGMPPGSQFFLSMGMAHEGIGDYENAEHYFRKAIEFKQNAPDWAPGNRKRNEIWVIQRALAVCLAKKGDYSEAKQIMYKVLSNVEKKISADDPGLGETYFDAGEIELLSGDYVKAAGFYAKGMKICLDLLSPTHLRLMNSKKNYIIALARSGQYEQAKGMSVLWKNATDKNVKNIITCGTESERLLFLQQNLNFDIPASFLDEEDLAACLINWKGAVLDSIINDRKRAALASDSLSKKNLQRLKRLNQSILNLQMNSNTMESKGGNAGLNELISEKMDIERKLFTKTKGDSLENEKNFTYKDIQNHIKADSVLVDIFEYKQVKDPNSLAKYAALIYCADGRPLRCELGSISEVDAKIEQLRQLISNPRSDSNAYTKASIELTNIIWEPIQKHFPPTVKNIYINPSGQINFVSYSSLVDDSSNFLGESYQISYVTSSKDITKPSRQSANNEFVIFNNPDFSFRFSDNKTAAAAQRTFDGALLSDSFTQLPGTQREGDQIERIATEKQFSVLKYSGIDASKENVDRINSPRILHLATHGFFLGSKAYGSSSVRGMKITEANGENDPAERISEKSSVDTSALERNPMLQSGLALAGAQDTIQSWMRGIVPPAENNGILTAEDVSMLDLQNNWLVTLSACESGVGRARSGEGVFGLRRAFMLAGAQNLLMTLWPVPDETTADFMCDFYNEALSTNDVVRSLTNVQRKWLLKLREERGLVTAVRDVGSFAVIMMANPYLKSTSMVHGEGESAQQSEKILDFQTALAMADAGSGYAQAIVSIYYGFGLGCDKDLEKSKHYVMLSVKQQNPLGIYRLAEMREAGEAMEQNSKQAAQLMHKAKSELQKLPGDPYAMTALAKIYERENQPPAKVRELLGKASEMGYTIAKEKLKQY
jgi:CHAT domain-containing protein/TPR repeat protein